MSYGDNPELSRILRLCVIFLILIATLAGINHFITGCGPQQKTITVPAQPAPGPQDPGPQPPAPPPPTSKCDAGMKVGDTKEVQCDAGQTGKKIFVCSDAGLQIGIDTCKTGGTACQKTKIDFTDVKPLIQNRCVSCHAGDQFDQYAVAKDHGDEMIRRIGLDPQNIQHMPKGSTLPGQEADTFRQWKSDGYLETDPGCSGQSGPQAFIRLDDTETWAIDDLNSLDVGDRTFTRYVDLSHKVDEGTSSADLQHFVDAANKGINSVNAEDQTILALTPVAKSNGTLLRLDLRNFGLTFADWVAIEQADQLKVTSFTTKGRLIKLLTGTQRAVMPVENLNDVMLHNASIYYRLIKAPGTLQQLNKQLDVDIKEQADAKELSFIGIPTSEITSEKNRMLVRFKGEQSGKYIAVWQTFDTLPLVFNGQSVIQRNLFQFPLLDGIGAKAVFHFDAGETIFELPNGGHAYFLSDAAGKRLDQADPNVVRDTRSPVSPIIQNALSCFNCHNGGFIPASDSVLAKVTANADQFLQNDFHLVQDLYKNQVSNNANFTADNRRYAAFLAQLGIKPTDPDPVTTAANSLLQTWNIKKLASFFKFTVDEAKQCINASAGLKQQIGQLLDDNASATFEQIVQVSQLFQKDCEFGQDEH